jgi:tRNA pseudouridine55 synthase
MTAPAGFLVIDKPEGVTSFSMVALVRRLTGVRRVGHAGTLDPLATGVLPVAIGQATRFIEYLDDAPKVYRALVRFGAATSTYDREGAVTATADASRLRATEVTATLAAFIGDVEQVPPMFSAIKVAGTPLYRHARKGMEIELTPRPVRIDSLTLLGFVPGPSPEADLQVVCGRGTYIRSLAHDLGKRLGVGAHLHALRRTASGGFGVRLASSPAEFERLAHEGRLFDAILAVDRAVERRPAAILSAEHARDVRAGRRLDLHIASTRLGTAVGTICRAYDTEGAFLGVLRHDQGTSWHPAKVLPTS